MKEMVCQQCGAPLVQKDSKHWYCPNCRLSYLADRDEEGYEFLYQPIEKKTIETGQMSQKATAIQIQKIAVREIKVSDNIEVEVARDALQLSKEEAIKAVEAHLGHGEYEKASEEINRYLAQDNNCAEILWDSILCEKRFVIKEKENGRRVLDGQFTPFSGEDKIKLERILENASPIFAKRVLNCCLSADFSDDNSCERIFTTCVPYVPNESVYSQEIQSRIIKSLFEKVISKGFSKSFEYLLKTLDQSSVDEYIDYNIRFAQKMAIEHPDIARKHLSDVLLVESGNSVALRMLVEIDLTCNKVSVDESIADFEKYLSFASNTDEAVLSVFSYIINQDCLTELHSKFVRQMMGYHSAAPQGLEKELLVFANKLLKSSLFNEAVEYFYLILSFDKKCEQAFFGLCLARITAKDSDDVINQDSLLKDCREFSKCIALADKAEQDRIYGLSKAQENRIKRDKSTKQEKSKKRNILIAVGATVLAIIIAIIIGVASCNAAKRREYEKTYSLDNFSMSITGKTDGGSSSYYGGYVVTLNMALSNSSTVDIYQIKGKMNVYQGSSNLLMVWDVNLTGTFNVYIPAGETIKVSLKCDSNKDEMYDFYNASLDELQITFTVSELVYHKGNGAMEHIENSSKKEKIVKAYDEHAVKDKIYEEV